MLASSLKAVLCQQLMRRAAGSGRVAACEVMVVNDAISNYVREGKIEQIPTAVQTGAERGCVTMDAYLAMLTQRGEITEEQAMTSCNSIKELRRFLDRPDLDTFTPGSASVGVYDSV